METCRTHRVGTITTGLVLIAFGVLFILHLFMNVITYELIFRFWPVILIGLGLEVLLTNFAKDKIVYDKAAIFLMLLLAFFAMGMACADMCMQYI
jgi:hypothetical protein